MLENKKNVRKILNIVIVLMAIIMILGIYIKVKYSRTNVTETETIGTKSFEHMKSSVTIADIGLEQGTINPIYKPEWEKVGSSLDTTNKKLTVTVKGYAYESQTIDSNVQINYASDVTSTLAKEDITVYVDGVEVTSTTNPEVIVNAGTETENSITHKTEITHTIVLSNLEQAYRQTNPKALPYKEWSGNIKIKIAGRGKETTTYNENVLKDDYGNQNMMQTDETGTWIDVTFSDTATNVNTNGTMFADFIGPEFTYKSAETIIGNGNNGGDKKVKVVFDIVDKYFNSATIDEDNITIKLIDTDTTIPKPPVTKTITKKTIDAEVTDATTGVTYKTNGDIYYNGNKIGERYEMVVENLDTGDGFTYSGPMSISFPGSIAKDNSNNVNDATTITIGIDETDGNTDTSDGGSAEIVDVVDPVWQAGTPTVTTNASGITSATVELTATDKYFKDSALTKELIQVLVGGTDISSIATELVKGLTGPTAVTNGEKYTFSMTNLEESYDAFIAEVNKYLANNGGRPYREFSGPTSIYIPASTAANKIIEDNYGNISKEFTVDLGTIDTLRPEIIKISSTNNADKTQTITFMITDKYFNTLDALETGEIIVKVNGEEADTIEKDLTTILPVAIKATVDGVPDTIVGYKYTLILSDFEETEKRTGKSFIEWSGDISIDIKEGAVKDKNGNKNALKNLEGNFADFIVPKVENVSSTNNADKTQTIVFTITDKYLDTTNALEASEITVKVNGEIADSVAKPTTAEEIAANKNKIFKDLTSSPITYDVDRDGTVESDEIVGYTYTLILSNFEQTEKQAEKPFYEWSGNITIDIAEGAVIDKGPKGDANGDATKANKNAITTINGKFADFIAPKIENVSSTNNADKTQTIVFTATDKYFDTTNVLQDGEITVFIDNEIPTGITKSLTSSPITYDVDRDGTVESDEVVGYTYTLVIGNIEQPRTSAVYGDYTDYSGTVTIKVAEGAVIDKGPNGDANGDVTKANKNTGTPISGKFVDFIKPDITYIYAESAQADPGDINYEGKTFTMVFEITDKYFESSVLDIDDLIIKIDGEIPDWRETGETVGVTKNLTIEEVKATFNKTVGTQVVNNEYVIGKRYTLVLSNLEQLQIQSGDQYLDYSGVITVAIPAGEIDASGNLISGAMDSSENLNDAVTITSGIDIPGGAVGDSEIVDVVDPLWTKVSSSASAIDPANPTSSTATIKIRGTDKYYSSTVANLEDKIKVWAQSGTEGAEPVDVTSSVNVDIGDATTVNKVGTTDQKVGEEYTITITGFAQDVNQIKIEILEDAMLDTSGNGNKVTEMILYNVLRLTDTEIETDNYTNSIVKPFLGETTIQRQYVQQVIFTNSMSGSIGAAKVWDVSAAQDNSIKAWTTQTTAPYTVYIGSDNEIFANQNSKALFNCIGYAESCTETETIKNLNLLNTSSVTNMEYMFYVFGFRAMTSFNIGNLDTRNVISMRGMFYGCGIKALTSLDLGNLFDTSNVTNMGSMFFQLGQNSMITLDLGDKFNTSNVQNMNAMFYKCGLTAMTNMYFGTTTGIETGIITLPDNFNTSKVQHMSRMFYSFGAGNVKELNLGNSFYTSEVTNMSEMFYGCGATLMTTLNLGTNFDTTKVQDMSGMFQNCGQTAMTSLDLGDKFYVTAATDMSNMFNACGTTAMTSLDLGPLFTKIVDTNTDFVTNTGKSGECTIYAPEAIYSSKTGFKLNSTSTTTITYANGTINPIYKPEWEKVGSSLDTTNKKITVTLKGSAYESLVLDTETDESGNVNVKSQVKYASDVTSTLELGDIQIFIDGVDATSIFINKSEAVDTTVPMKELKAGTQSTNATSGKKEITHEFILYNFEETIRQAGLSYKEWSGNISLKIGGRGKESSTYSANVLKDSYGNQNMMETDKNGINSNGTWIDIKFGDTETDRNANGTMFADFIKPEITYKYAGTSRDENASENPEIDYGDKTVTVVFDVTDKYFSNTDLATVENIENQIIVKMSDYTDNEVNAAIQKSIEKVEDVYDTDGTTKIGERYKLVISKLEQTANDGFKFSGYMNVVFPSDIVTDKSENKNAATTIAIGLDDTDGNPQDNPGNGVIVDVVDPVWEVVESSIDTGAIVLRAKDKYFASSTLDEDSITVYVNGVPSNVVGKDLGDPIYKKLDASGNYVTADITEAIAVEYTLQLSNITLDTGAYIEFTPTNASDLVGETAKYKAENGGAVKIQIAAGVAKDDSGNGNKVTTFDIGVMDSTNPEVYLIEKTQNASANTETIIFNVTDRNYYDSDLIEEDEITLWIDGIQTTGIKIESLTSKPINAAIDNTVKALGHQYTLVLSEIAETHEEFVASGREFKELSGTLEVKIAANAARDINLNTLNPATTTLSDFVDFIKPELTYKYTVSTQETPGDIHYGDKTFTMVFEILDKYIKESTLKNQLEEATTEAEKQAVIEDFLTILIDSETPDWSKVDKDLTVEEVEATTAFKKTVDGTIVNDTHVIGYKYTLVLSSLEQLQILSGDKYLDYSGVVTTALEAGIATDTTGNSSIETTITSGLDIVGDVQLSGTIQNVDVVDPLWEKVSSSASAIDPTNPTSSTATITFKGTDKFFNESKITQDNIKNYIKVLAHTGSTPGSAGLADITDSVNITIDDTEDITDTVNSIPNMLIGKQYTITITGFAQDVNQIKIAIQPDTMMDTSGNGNKLTEMILYNVLRLTETEVDTDIFINSAEKSFLGETTIQRQYVQQVIFTNSMSGSTGAAKVWDVSAAGDGSIKAWTTQTTAPYTVYIGSDNEIFANQNSTALFSFIGYAESCTETETIKNLSLLNTSSVTNMKLMFFGCGYRSMTSLDLGNFDTKNVTNMKGMFFACGKNSLISLDLGNLFDTSKVNTMYRMFFQAGQETMITLDLGDKFDTSNVNNMDSMFYKCGQKEMTNMYFGTTTGIETGVITLPDNFNTSKVQIMSQMFEGFGAGKVKELNLGNNFYTSEVTDMYNMFKECGQTAMETLNLGNNFNTAKVQDMSGMFQGFAQNSTTMTTLDLGEKFYTTAATTMANMFNGCGTTAMTTLDLGPAFTKIADTNTDFVTNCGKSGAVIYAPESIYNDMKHFKLSTDSTTTIEYTQGTINAKYKPEWTKVSSSLTIEEADNLADSIMTIVVNGKVDSTVYANAIQTITSAVTAGNDTNNQINVTVDGEGAEDITQTVVVETAPENQVQYTITLSNFEKAVRKSGKNFKEWAGNVALQFAKGSLMDAYGNKNMTQIDVDPDGDGTTEIQQIQIKDDTSLSANVETDKMFADFVKPEFTYEFAETTIGSGPTGDKKVKVVFDVTDKYFSTTTLATDENPEDLITVKVDTDVVNGTVNVQKTLTKTAIFVMNKETKVVTSKATDYEVQSTEQKVGERYELLVEGLETENGVGYSGPMTLTFPAGTIEDLSGNQSVATTITIGIDDPTNPDHDGNPEGETDHTSGVIVDVVNPLWTGPHDVNTINRTNDTVSITIIGSDKYYASNTLDEDKISVYVDNVLDGDTNKDGELGAGETATISKSLTEITDSTQLATLAANAGLPSDVELIGYVLTLGNFGDQPEDISGKTKIVIEPGTIVDDSNNQNLETTIFVGNEDWEETNEPLESGETGYPRYPAFRNDIVDFIDPVINYEYSTVEGSENPDVDYEEKTVTVKFTVTDKYLLASDLIKEVEEEVEDEDGNITTVTKYLPKNIKVIVAGTEVYNGNSETQPYQVTTSISETDITGGKEYTLVISNLEQDPNNGFNFSGTMQLVFEPGVIEDTSGNTNTTTTITLDTEIGNDVVDVVDPVIYYTSSSIDRIGNTVTLMLRADDKYLASETLENNNTVIVKVVDEAGNVIVNDNTTITKTITKTTQQLSSSYMMFRIVLKDFGVYEGKTSVIIPEGLIKDTSGNGNKETEILVGNTSDATAFGQSIVDFTEPTWEYVTSSINRDVDANGVRTETGTVTLEVKGTDIYFDKDTYFTNAAKQLDLSKVNVYVNNVLNTAVTKSFATNDDGTIKKEYIEETKELATGYSRVLKGVKYTLVLGNFGTNEDEVRIEIPADAIKDTSLQGNILTSIDVGNPEWIETIGLAGETEDTSNPKYTAFRNDIVDYIKPVIKYQYQAGVNPLIHRENETVDIIFTATDKNFLESNIGTEDMKIYIDDMQVYGTGANTNIDISANLATPVATENNDGLKYTLTLSALELNGYIEDVDNDGVLDEGEDINGNGQLDKLSDIFERHSGVIKIVFAANQVADSSGNKNIETTIVVDNGDGDDQANGVIVDFVNPNIYYQDKYVNWEDRYALITLRATDRFYDTDTELKVSDIKLYEEREKDDGTIEYIDITNNFTGKISITKSNPLTVDGNTVGYDYTIRLNDFEEEFKMKISINAGAKDAEGNVLNGIADTSGNLNDATDILVDLDNRRPVWKYVSTDTSSFETSGIISFNVKGIDKFLDLTNSKLQVANIKILKDGVVYLDGTNATDATKITVTHTGDDEDEKSKSYTIKVTGLSEMGTYSLVFAKDTLVDEFNNKSAATTINFSNSVIASNTGNYINVTYHVTPDMETVHSSYVHELMSVNTTGTNFENTTYRPSTLGELFNNGENPLFKEPMYGPSVDGYTISSVYAPKSFAGWAVCDEDGKVADGATVYGLYDEIPKTVTNLKAVWQDATVIFVSASAENTENNDGKLPTTPVADLATAYSLLDADGTAASNIIVIMDAVEWDETTALIGNATITSLYAGVDYRTATHNAELKISSNMTVNGDIIFDNIKLYASSTTVSDGTDYLGNGTYTNMLISNYSGDITLGRGITTPSDKYTFGAIIGGNYKTETSTGELGTHTIRVEAGKYNNIIAGSTLADGKATIATKSITHNVVIGNMKDAAVSRNDKLTITGYVTMGENEQKCYPSGATSASTSVDEIYSDVTLYSGTFTGINKFKKANENVAIYLRSINGQTDGEMEFEMFGGLVTGNIYAGSRISTGLSDVNTMKFYGGQLTGNMFGQGANDTFTGSSIITLQGIFTMTGNIFGGSNRTSTVDGTMGTGNATITLNSSSVTVSGNIYGGSNVTVASTGYVTGDTNITINSGSVLNIYGGGYNSGNLGTAKITIENGTISQNIFGGAYNNQVRTASNITVLGGTVLGNIYGGNENLESQLDGDTYFQDVKIVIGNTDTTKKPTISGNIYGGGKYDKLDVAEIQLIECTNVTSVFGGSDTNAVTSTANIYLKGMTVNEIYGGGDEAGTVGVANIYLQSGTATEVYGGGYKANVAETNILLEGIATITTIYGGSNTSGTVTTSNVTLKSGNLTNVFGGGNSAVVGTANVTLDGITINQIHGGSKDAGITTTTNVTLTAGTVGEVFGGGLDVGVTTANIKQQGATVTTIYGGNNSGTGIGGDTGTTNIDILNSTVANVYGGNKEKGTTRYTNINIHGTSTITGKLYGGGYKSAIGKSGETGTTTINIAGGTINGDINGGSEQSVVYGNTNINVGYEATSELTAGAINIIGTIYGAGDTLTAGTTTVVGNTNITMDNSSTYPITYFTAAGKEKSIYGSGKGGAIYSNGTDTDNSTIHIKDFGTADDIYEFASIENTGNLYIGNSVIELIGNKDTTNGHYYTLNKIINALTIYNNTTVYTQRGFNKVGGFYSYLNQKSTRATVTITDGVAETNVDNRLYTLEGINLIFAKKEVTYNNKSTLAQADWGEVTGMAYFGMYKNTSTIKANDYDKEYDLDLFNAGTYVEGQYNSSHNIERDGFYTDVVDSATGTEKAQVIDTTNYTYYCDWIINAPTVNYDVDLIASTYGEQSVAELLLDYKYATDYTYKPETIYTLNQVSTNALKPGITLVDPTNPTNIPTLSANANNTFGLTMETTTSGWQKQASTTIYTASNGSFGGDSVYMSDTSATPGKIKFKVYNSLNITEEKDLGNVNIILTGQQPISENGAEAYTFKVVIAVNLQTLAIELKEQYIPSFTDKAETELSYTTDSRVDLSYILMKDYEATPYKSGDYRVISTTEKLPAGTRITMKDYGQGDTLNKVYYYHVTGTETETDGTRYLYRLSNFIDIGSTNDTYADIESNIPYYHSAEGLILEKYDISINFIDSNINADRLAQETYLELRHLDSDSGAITVRYDNGDTTIKYNLKAGKNAVATETISNAGSSYSIVDTLEIPITINASILEQAGILDTKYYDQIAGIAIQIVGESGARIKSPELQNFKLTNTKTNKVYEADANGVIRMPIIEGLGSKSGDYKLSLTQANVTAGTYTAQVILYTADDGKYYGTEPELEPLEFNITFIGRLAGLMGVEAEPDTRIVSKSTGLNLAESATGIDMTIGISNPSNATNIRVELYKRNPTYTSLTDENTYTGTSYTLVDIKDYLQGSWETPETHELTSAAGSKEYIVSARKTYVTAVQLETIEFEKAIKEGISTGEYKLVFKAYSDDTLVQTFNKTFIVVP